jgi:hypothetical protein
VFTFYLVVCGQTKFIRADKNAEILKVLIEQQPWMVSIGRFLSRTRWEHDCSGSLITSKHILTAAECIAAAQLDDKYRKK